MKLIVLHRSVFILWCITMLHIFILQNFYAQNIFKGVLKGIVIDDSTKTPLPLANIFVSGTTIGTAAGRDGKFQITNVPYGIHQIVASFIGYTPQIETVDMTDTKEKDIVFRLKSYSIQLSSIIVKGSEPLEWKQNLKKFIAQFFGTTPNSEQCKLLNPEILDFNVNKETSEFTATVREPLIIENKALGYRLYYYLKYYNDNKNVFQFYGVENFEQLHAENPEEIEQWRINRLKTYYGSRRHFFFALFHKKWMEEGFKVKWIPRKVGLSTGIDDEGRPSHVVIKDAFNKVIVYESNTNITHELDPDTLLTDGDTIYEKKLSFQDILQVTYGNIFNKKTSRVELEQKSIIIYSNGEVAEPLGISTFGYWSTQRAAELLPWDYEPE